MAAPSDSAIVKGGQRLLLSLGRYLLLWGIPGLLILSFIDAASVPIVSGPDLLVLLLSWQRPSQIVLVVLAAVVGSTLGYVVLYRVARLGSAMALRPFNAERRAWVKRKLDRNAFLTVAAGVAAPPPFPTKLVIVAAGAFGVSQGRFAGGVFAGRLLRYSVLAFLGARFGDHAADVLQEHFRAFAIALIAIVILILIVRHFRK